MTFPRETEAPRRREWSEREAAQREAAHSPVLPAEKARQGVTGHNVRYVLGLSVAASIIVFVAIYLVYFG
jgi:hypothetical protein